MLFLFLIAADTSMVGPWDAVIKLLAVIEALLLPVIVYRLTKTTKRIETNTNGTLTKLREQVRQLGGNPDA